MLQPSPILCLLKAKLVIFRLQLQKSVSLFEQVHVCSAECLLQLPDFLGSLLGCTPQIVRL
jgi:hypothetical protein